jgi:hypothetical protein
MLSESTLTTSNDLCNAKTGICLQTESALMTKRLFQNQLTVAPGLAVHDLVEAPRCGGMPDKCQCDQSGCIKRPTRYFKIDLILSLFASRKKS